MSECTWAILIGFTIGLGGVLFGAWCAVQMNDLRIELSKARLEGLHK